MHDERRERNTAAGTGSAGDSYGGYGASGSYRSNATYGGAYPSSSDARGENPYRSSAPYAYPPYGSYGPGNTPGTGWETVPIPATTHSWHQPFSPRSGPGSEKLPSPATWPPGAAATPAGASSRQKQKKGVSMPKEQARRLAQRLKRWAVALAVAGFGTFSALVAFHQASATASSSSSSGSQSQISTPASGNSSSSSSSSSSSTNASSSGSGASSSSSSSSSSPSSSSSAGSSSSQDGNGFFNQQGGDNFGSQPTFGQGHSGSGVS